MATKNVMFVPIWNIFFSNKHNVENYRPITTLSIIVKVFESLLSKQITHYFDSTLSPRLTAYRENHSCETTLLRLTEDWKHAIDRKELVTILSTDMSKAFDSLCHNLVIKKLKAYGFTNQSLDLIRSFLNDGYSRVKLGTIRSEVVLRDFHLVHYQYYHYHDYYGTYSRMT